MTCANFGARSGYHDRDGTTNAWFRQVFVEPGPEGEALGAHVFPHLESDRFFLPDAQVSGLDLAPPSDAHRQKIPGAVDARVMFGSDGPAV